MKPKVGPKIFIAKSETPKLIMRLTTSYVYLNTYICVQFPAIP